MKIAVCDDEIHFIDAICPLLEKWAKEREIKHDSQCSDTDITKQLCSVQGNLF